MIQLRERSLIMLIDGGLKHCLECLKPEDLMIESTHFNQQERLSKLLALISLALCWAILIGEGNGYMNKYP